MAKGPYSTVPGDQGYTADDRVKHSQTAATATTHAGGVTIPALAAGYIVIDVNGASKKVPYYDV